MSRRSERRAAARAVEPDSTLTPEPAEDAFAFYCIVRSAGAYRRIKVWLPMSVIEAHAHEISEPEYLPMQLASVMGDLEDEATR